MTKDLESLGQIVKRLRATGRRIGCETYYGAARAKEFESFCAGRNHYSTYETVLKWYDAKYAPPPTQPELIPTHPFAEPSAPKHDALIAALTDNTEAIRALTRSVARLSGRHFMDAEAVAKLMNTADQLNRAGELLGCVESATMRLVNVMNALGMPQQESQD